LVLCDRGKRRGEKRKKKRRREVACLCSSFLAKRGGKRKGRGKEEKGEKEKEGQFLFAFTRL